MTTADQRDDPDQLDELFAASPDLGVHTAASAVLGLLVGGVAVLTAGFALTEGLSTAAAGIALLVSVVGLARASRPTVAGTAMASAGLVLALLAGAAYGLRHLGFDTAVGDPLLPALRALLDALDAWIPQG